MNIKDLIEAVKFQVSVKPQDDFMREIAEGLEKLHTANLKVCSDYDAACDELKKWQKLQPIICPACHRGCFSNDKFCPHCGTSLRNNKAPTEKISATEMTDNGIIKALEKQIEKALDYINRQDSTIAELTAKNNRQKAEIERLERHELKEAMTFNNDTIKRAADEAVKEFAERLKERAKANEWNGTICGLDIDNLVKEMVGEDND